MLGLPAEAVAARPGNDEIARAIRWEPIPHVTRTQAQSYKMLSETRRVARMTSFMAGVGSPKVTRLSICSIGCSVTSSGSPFVLANAS